MAPMKRSRGFFSILALVLGCADDDGLTLAALVRKIGAQ